MFTYSSGYSPKRARAFEAALKFAREHQDFARRTIYHQTEASRLEYLARVTKYEADYPRFPDRFPTRGSHEQCRQFFLDQFSLVHVNTAVRDKFPTNMEMTCMKDALSDIVTGPNDCFKISYDSGSVEAKHQQGLVLEKRGGTKERGGAEERRVTAEVSNPQVVDLVML